MYSGKISKPVWNWRKGFPGRINYFWPEMVDVESEEIISRYDKGQIILTALKRSSTAIIRLATNWQGYFIDNGCGCYYSSPKFKKIK